MRAQTAQARTQVELAQLQYLLPRLKGLWTHLERQRGGIGMRGPGEKEIETDRRVINDKIAKLKSAKASDPNPFVIGNDRYLKMWNIVSECIQAEISRRDGPN